MLRLAVTTAQAFAVGLIAYNAITSIWGWRDRAPAPSGPRTRKLRVVIPAHDEERVIGGILGDLSACDYPNKEVWVLADRCRDGTVDAARSLGAQIAEREEGEDGKGAALAWYLSKAPLDVDEAIVVLDADNRVDPSTLSRIADELDAGHEVVQCYLDVANPDDSLMAEASAISYWAGNRMIQLARSNLGWSADLGGTGMALTSRALASVGGFSASLTEDQDLAVRLLLAGKRVEWLHDVRVKDEKPGSLGVTLRQRARWMAGKRGTRRKHLISLLRTGEPAALDQAIRLVQPGRSFMALVSGLLTLAAVTGASWLFAWEVWAAVTILQVLEPLPFLARDGVPVRRLLRYPLLTLVAALWVPVRIISSRTSGWYHTPHGVDPDLP